MRRYILLTLLFIATSAYAIIQRQAQIGPASSSTNVSIPAAGTTLRNCLSQLDVISDAAYTLNVLNGGTTMYSLGISAGGSIVRDWRDEDALCTDQNTALFINVSAGSFTINYSGFTR